MSSKSTVQITDQIMHLKSKIAELRNESVQIPTDMALAYSSRRPELLKLIKRPMTEDETVAVLNILVGEMLINESQKEFIEEYEELTHDFQERFSQIEALI